MIVVSSIYRREPQVLRQGAGYTRLWALGLALALAGCDRPLNGAIDLFHDMEGGPITQLRPPPPGVNDPYPYIGTTPARPLAPDIAAEQRIGDSLAAQRDAATADAARDPIKTVPPVAPPPKPAAADPNANRVSVDAAPSPTPPARPAPKPATAGLDSVPAPADAVESGPLPDFAAAPPAVPQGLGVVVPPPPPVAAPLIVKPPAPTPGGVFVAFTPGSSTLPPSATLTLRRFVMAHRTAGFAVVAHGDGGAKDADSQSRAMELGLKRAAAIATSLGSAGVPANKIQLRADAIGTGSAATLN
jgi:outer membrane protein OmpA-like peptidoglycan-associated protein